MLLQYKCSITKSEINASTSKMQSYCVMLLIVKYANKCSLSISKWLENISLLKKILYVALIFLFLNIERFLNL